MIKWTFLTMCVIVILIFLLIGFPVLAAELSLQQVIEAVNFASMAIEAAELRANLYISPRPRLNSLYEKMEVDLQELKIQYHNTSNPVEKQTLAQYIKNGEDLQNSPPLPRYYEYTIIFRRNEINDDDNSIIERFKSLYSYRIFRVNRASNHADPQFLKSVPEIARGMYTGQEIQTLISNGESVITLTVNDRLDNTAYFDEPSVGRILALLFRGAGVAIPINPERVIGFESVAQNGTTLYSIEYTHEIPGTALAGLGKFNSTRIRVNPSKTFSVTKMENFLHIGGKKVLKATTQFDGFKLFPGRIWYPTSIQFTEYKENQEVVEHLFEIHEADFNVSIPHDFFHVQESDIRKQRIDIQQ